MLRLEKKRQELLELYLEHSITKAEFQHTAAKCDGEMARIQEAQRDQTAQSDLPEVRLRQVEALIDGTEWDDTFYRHILERITIHPDNTLEISLMQLSQSLCYSFGQSD
ncbi:hypothetical protein [Provencibacterium massiliense]|uniref:hypothetical protein n=1 Tax=Provencibacterium massiliense TaxID=1841868 RepID=UPI0015F30442|nr:hypothetical protein [Provencibacterium massiliense]